MHITLQAVLDYTAVSKTKNCCPNNAIRAVWRNKQKRGVTEQVTPQNLLRSKQRKEILMNNYFCEIKKFFMKAGKNGKHLFNLSKKVVYILIKEFLKEYYHEKDGKRLSCLH